MTRHRVFIGVGSNIDPHVHVPRALARLRALLTKVRTSTFYCTPALRRPADPDFWNGVVAGHTGLGHDELRHALRQVEADLGRRRTRDAYAPRTIDLDVLLHGDALLDGDVHTRAFVAVPLLELAPDLVLPDGNVPLREVVAAFGDARLEPVDLPRYPSDPTSSRSRVSRSASTS